jgi:uncharacterized protein with GYD domain
MLPWEGSDSLDRDQASTNSPWDRDTSPRTNPAMPKYIRLTSLTKKGHEQIQESAERTEQMREMAEENGGTIEDVFLTFGDFDFVTIAEFPDDKSYAEFALKTAKGGEYGAKTLKAIEEDDYISIIEEL